MGIVDKLNDKRLIAVVVVLVVLLPVFKIIKSAI